MMPHWNVSGYTQKIISDMRKPEKWRRGEKISKFGKYINYITTKKCEDVKYTPQTIHLFQWLLGPFNIMISF